MRVRLARLSCVVRFVLVVLLWAGYGSAGAAERAYVVLASYSEIEGARAELERLAKLIPEALTIARAEQTDRTLYRVVAGPFLAARDARGFVQEAGDAGVHDAWILREAIASPATLADGLAASSGATTKATGRPPPEAPGFSTLAGKSTRQREATAARRDRADVSTVDEPPTRLALVVPPALDRSISRFPGAEQGDILGVHPTFDIPRFKERELQLRIDGRLDEAVWASVPGYDNMHVIEPDTLADPPLKTRTQFFYTDRGLYVGMWNEQDPDTLVARLSSRDAMLLNRDGNAITLDTSGEGRYGYWFGVNLGGSLMDGTVLPERQFRTNWDGPWDGASEEVDTGWTAEYFLPWSMMNMPEQREGQREMAFYTSRKVAYLDERWAWPALPMTQPKFMSTLQRFRLEGVNPRQQYTVYPYVSATWDDIANDMTYKVGGDIFWRPTSNFQLSTTLAPDFGQVESDDVIINLTAFETFFPEKRPFFLEGFEIFIASPRAQFRGAGGAPTTLINTRRIGANARLPAIPADAEFSVVELNKATELYGAAKVVGQSGRLRYGVLAAFEEDQRFRGRRNDQDFRLDQDGRDFGAARLLYEDNQGGAYRALGWLGTIVRHPEQDASVQSIDYHYLSPRGKWKLDGQSMFSQVDAQKDGFGSFIDLGYVPRQGIRHSLALDHFDDNLDVNDFGFIRRNDTINFLYMFDWTEPNVARFKERRTNIFLSQEHNTRGRAVRSGLFLRQFFTLYNLSRVRLEFDWFPPRWDDTTSRGNGDFRIEERGVFTASYTSDSSRKLFYELGVERRGEEIGGTQYSYNTVISYRPSDRFSASLALRYRDRDGWLVHTTGRNLTTYQAEEWQPRLDMDFFFSSKQQLRFSLQWNGIKAFEDEFFQVPLDDGSLEARIKDPSDPTENFAISELNLQIRYRWEIAPLSDLFIVYTKNGDLDNPLGESFTSLAQEAFTRPLAEQLVVKLRYRFGT